MDSIELKVLGEYGSYRKGKGCISFLLDNTVLLDVGSVFEQLEVEDVLKIEHVFISHSHFDHIKDLPFLIDCFLEAEDKSFNIYCTTETKKAIFEHLFNKNIWFDLEKVLNHSPVVKFVDIQNGFDFIYQHIHVKTFASNHSVPCFGFMIESNQSSIVISSDTFINTKIHKICNSLIGDITLFIECSFPNRKEELAKISKHLTPNTVLKCLDGLNKQIDVYVYHLKPAFEKETLVELKNKLDCNEFVAYKGMLKTGHNFLL